jgi:ribosomal protein L21
VVSEQLKAQPDRRLEFTEKLAGSKAGKHQTANPFRNGKRIDRSIQSEDRKKESKGNGSKA